jgi:hypothetical protein
VVLLHSEFQAKIVVVAAMLLETVNFLYGSYTGLCLTSNALFYLKA